MTHLVPSRRHGDDAVMLPGFAGLGYMAWRGGRK